MLSEYVPELMIITYFFWLGWEFVDCVMSGKQTFRGFVTCINNKYKRWNPNGQSFMSLNTFIDWWFGWASEMRIDFRVPCRACGGESDVLARDGTKIDISFKNMCVEPIETVSSDDPPTVTSTRRHDRSFLRGNKVAKTTLETICNKILKKQTPSNYDDTPASSCNKKFPTVSKKKFFIYFCGFVLYMAIVMDSMSSPEAKEGKIQQLPYIYIDQKHSSVL